MSSLGFSADTFRFYDDLAHDNSREFWAAQRQRYETAVHEPMLALLDALSAEFGAGRLFRPHRDIRFSQDKRPYKEHQGGYVPAGSDTGYYVHADADGLLLGVGWYRSSPEQVARWRAAINEPRLLIGLRAALAHADSHGMQRGGQVVATRPRGVSADDPNLDLLRHRTLTLDSRFDVAVPWLTTDALVDHVTEAWRAGRPLVQWLVANVVGEPS